MPVVTGRFYVRRVTTSGGSTARTGAIAVGVARTPLSARRCQPAVIADQRMMLPPTDGNEREMSTHVIRQASQC